MDCDPSTEFGFDRSAHSAAALPVVDGLGPALGWFNSHIILGAVFLLVLQPIAFVMRLTGYDPLRRRSQQLTTYREKRHTAGINLTRIF